MNLDAAVPAAPGSGIAGEGDGERGAVAGLARHVDGAAVCDHDRPRDVQAEPEPAVARRRDRALEPIEDVRPARGIDADAVIGDGEDRAATVAAEADLDRLAARELERVSEQ